MLVSVWLPLGALFFPEIIVLLQGDWGLPSGHGLVNNARTTHTQALSYSYFYSVLAASLQSASAATASTAKRPVTPTATDPVRVRRLQFAEATAASVCTSATNRMKMNTIL